MMRMVRVTVRAITITKTVMLIVKRINAYDVECNADVEYVDEEDDDMVMMIVIMVKWIDKYDGDDAGELYDAQQQRTFNVGAACAQHSSSPSMKPTCLHARTVRNAKQ